MTGTQTTVVQRLANFIGSYKLYSSGSDIYKRLVEKAQKILVRCKDTLRETL